MPRYGFESGMDTARQMLAEMRKAGGSGYGRETKKEKIEGKEAKEKFEHKKREGYWREKEEGGEEPPPTVDGLQPTLKGGTLLGGATRAQKAILRKSEIANKAAKGAAMEALAKGKTSREEFEAKMRWSEGYGGEADSSWFGQEVHDQRVSSRAKVIEAQEKAAQSVIDTKYHEDGITAQKAIDASVVASNYMTAKAKIDESKLEALRLSHEIKTANDRVRAIEAGKAYISNVRAAFGVGPGPGQDQAEWLKEMALRVHEMPNSLPDVGMSGVLSSGKTSLWRELNEIGKDMKKSEEWKEQVLAKSREARAMPAIL